MSHEQASFSVKTFCKVYDIGMTSAYADMKSGKLPFRKRGRRTLIRKEDADAWLNALPKGDRNELQAPGK